MNDIMTGWDGLEASRAIRLCVEALDRGEPAGPLKRALLAQADHIRPLGVPVPLNQEVLSEPSSQAPVEYHLDCLHHLDWTDPTARLKARFHLIQMGQAIDPLEPMFAPRVSVVVVTQNHRETIARCLASVARQTLLPCETIVVDAQSTDGTAPLVASLPKSVRWFDARVQSIPQARAQGLAAATGDWVLFLEPTDELLPLALEQLVEAARFSPDARVSVGTVEGSRGLPPYFELPAWDDERSMLGDSLLSACSRASLSLSTALVPRWFLLTLGEMRASLPGVDGAELAFHLGRAGAKVVALPSVTVRTIAPPAVTEPDLIREQIETDLAHARLLSTEPRRFRYIAPLVTRITWMMDRAFDLNVNHELIEQWDQQVSDFENRVGRDFATCDGATAILLDQILAMLRRTCELQEDATRPTLRLWTDRQERLLERIRRVKYVTGSDLRRWLPDIPPKPVERMTRSERASLKWGLEQLQVSLVFGELPIRLSSLERVAADYPGHPYERYWASAFRLARMVGDETARSVFRQSVVRQGWQWMGRARQTLARRQVG